MPEFQDNRTTKDSDLTTRRIVIDEMVADMNVELLEQAASDKPYNLRELILSAKPTENELTLLTAHAFLAIRQQFLEGFKNLLFSSPEERDNEILTRLKSGLDVLKDPRYKDKVPESMVHYIVSRLRPVIEELRTGQPENPQIQAFFNQ